MIRGLEIVGFRRSLRIKVTLGVVMRGYFSVGTLVKVILQARL